MFSSLSQGSIVYILDKTESPKLKYGEIVGVSAPKFQAMGTTIDLKVNIDSNVQDFSNIPSNNTIVSYNNGKFTISKLGNDVMQFYAVDNNQDVIRINLKKTIGM